MKDAAHCPIPTPSYLRQYRAIGLVYGQYQRSEEHLNQGNILTLEGQIIDAVLLGRLISLVKNHLDLERPHLWVVYPRTGKEDDRLHLQIVGVWEPQTLQQQEALTSTPQTAISSQPGYFSVRGEVIFSCPEKVTVMVKIRQALKPDSGEKPKFFKLKLRGCLPDKAINRFWDLQVQLQGNTLVLQSATDLGLLLKKSPPKPAKRPRRETL